MRHVLALAVLALTVSQPTHADPYEAEYALYFDHCQAQADQWLDGFSTDLADVDAFCGCMADEAADTFSLEEIQAINDGEETAEEAMFIEEHAAACSVVVP